MASEIFKVYDDMAPNILNNNFNCRIVIVLKDAQWFIFNGIKTLSYVRPNLVVPNKKLDSLKSAKLKIKKWTQKLSPFGLYQVGFLSIRTCWQLQ